MFISFRVAFELGR